MVKCPGCETEKDIEEFGWKYKNKTRNYWCKQCVKDYNKQHYQANKKAYLEKKKKAWAVQQAWFLEYKKTLKCSKCPENHPKCLEFHHTSKKNFTVSAYIGRVSQARILKEIALCVVLCANCHRKEHYD